MTDHKDPFEMSWPRYLLYRYRRDVPMGVQGAIWFLSAIAAGLVAAPWILRFFIEVYVWYFCGVVGASGSCVAYH